MAKTSIHFKPCNIAASEAHNKRKKKLNYIREELSHLNETFSYIDKSLQRELSAIKKEVKKKTGRALQKNANPIIEGVLVIEEGTTMEQVKKFCNEVAAKWDIRPLQIHIHRDEGHKRSKTWKPNYHAHVVFSVYNSEGRNARIQKSDCREMQTMAAAILGMERGKSSSRKHLDSLMFKIEQLEKRNEELEHKIAVFEGAKQGISDLFTGKARRKVEKAEKEAEETKREANKKIAEAERKAEEVTKRADQAEKENTELKKKLQIAENSNKTLSDEVKDLKVYKSTVESQKRLTEALYDEKRRIIKNIADVLPETQKYGLSTADAIQLSIGEHVSVKTLNVGGVTFSDKKGFILKWANEIRVYISVLLQKDNERDIRWLKIEEWAKRMKDYLQKKKMDLNQHRSKGTSMGI